MSATLEQLDKISLDYVNQFERIHNDKECWSYSTKRGGRYYYIPCLNKETSLYITPKFCWLRYYCNKHKKGIKLSEQDIFYLKIK